MGAGHDNPFFNSDLTNINRKVPPEKSIPPTGWEGLSTKKKEARISQGVQYVFFEYYIYDKHELLPEYELGMTKNKFKTNYYMIDFRNIYRLDCKRFQSAIHSPLETKILQLSLQARIELQQKLHFFYRLAPEDQPLIEI